jgi:hypothetical protein
MQDNNGQWVPQDLSLLTDASRKNFGPWLNLHPDWRGKVQAHADALYGLTQKTYLPLEDLYKELKDLQSITINTYGENKRLYDGLTYLGSEIGNFLVDRNPLFYIRALVQVKYITGHCYAANLIQIDLLRQYRKPQGENTYKWLAKQVEKIEQEMGPYLTPTQAAYLQSAPAGACLVDILEHFGIAAYQAALADIETNGQNRTNIFATLGPKRPPLEAWEKDQADLESKTRTWHLIWPWLMLKNELVDYEHLAPEKPQTQPQAGPNLSTLNHHELLVYYAITRPWLDKADIYKLVKNATGKVRSTLDSYFSKYFSKASANKYEITGQAAKVEADLRLRGYLADN